MVEDKWIHIKNEYDYVKTYLELYSEIVFPLITCDMKFAPREEVFYLIKYTGK